MAGEWEVRKIGELGKVVTGKTPSTKKPEYFGGEYPFITIPDLNGRRDIAKTARTLSPLGAKTMANCLLPPGAVMMSCIATIGKCGITTRPSFTNQQINSVICGKGVNPKFLYYTFTQLKSALEAVGGGGSVYTNVSKSRFSNIEVQIPPLKEQQAIACILGALDDKIELNRRMNETLEAMARAIFKSWFVDFDPVRAKAEGQQPLGLAPHIADLFPDAFEESELGEIPKGWRVVTFEELADAKQGKYIPKNEMSALPTTEHSYPVWGGNGIRGYSSNYMYEEPVVVLTCRGSNCGRIDLTESQSWISNISFACRPKYGTTSFIYVYFHYSSFENCISGSAQPQITYTALKNKLMEYPIDEAICDTFSKKIDRFYEAVFCNNRQSKILAALRDTLLPKLISGELRVPDAERIVGRCV